MPPIERDMSRRILKDLPVRLTEEEILERGRRQARTVEILKQTQDEKKAVTSDLGAKEKLLTADLQLLARVITSGQEWRQVECEESVDFRAAVVRIVRCDTGEEVTCRPLTAKERQGTFAFEEVE